jgi:site-specific recombinase XerD
VDAIFEAYLAAQRRRRPSPLTIKAITHALQQTQRWLDQHDLAAGELGLLRCEEYFDELLERQAVSTVRRHLAYVRAAYRYGVRHELVERDPTADVRLPRLPDHDPAIYSNEQLRQVHAAIRTEREGSSSSCSHSPGCGSARSPPSSGGRSSSSAGSSASPVRAASSASSPCIRP